MVRITACFLKGSKGKAVGWLNLIIATTVSILWKNLPDTVDNNGQDSSIFQIGKMNIDFFN